VAFFRHGIYLRVGRLCRCEGCGAAIYCITTSIVGGQIGTLLRPNDTKWQ